MIEDSRQLKKLLDPLVNTVEKIGIDTETTGLDPYLNQVRLIQIAIAKHPVFIIDLADIEKSELTPLKHLLASNCLKIGHNLKFDLMMLATTGINLAPPYFDTYLGYKVLTAGLRKTSTLEMVARKLLRVKLDKSAQKSDFGQNLTEEQLQYAANYAAVLLPLHGKLNRQLDLAKLTKTAKTEFDCLNAVARMELNGVRLDLDKWQLLKQDLLQQQAELEQKLQAHLNRGDRHTNNLLTPLKINLSSPKQIVAAFNRLEINVKSTNIRELIPLAQDYPVIRWLLEYRSLTTKINTFSIGSPQFIHPVTNRIQGHWWQMGARSGTRVSYSLDGRRRVWSKRTKPTLNELLNHPIQGTNATIIKRAIALLDSSVLSKVLEIKLILDVKFNSDGNAAPIGIGITIAAFNWFEPNKTVDYFANTPTKYNDLKALNQFVRKIIDNFGYIW